jgi:hypothetical protein
MERTPAAGVVRLANRFPTGLAQISRPSGNGAAESTRKTAFDGNHPGTFLDVAASCADVLTAVAGCGRSRAAVLT